MKLMNESKQEKLPIDFITSFISKGWEEVGVLKASIDSIKHEFKDTKKVEEILSDLMDAYLVCISQLQGYMDKKDYIELPDEEQTLKEDFCIVDHKTGKTVKGADGKALTFDSKQKALYYAQENDIWAEASDIKHYEPGLKALLQNALSKTESLSDEQPEAEAEAEISEESQKEEKQLEVDQDGFEYFCDFDDVKPSDGTIDVDEAFGLK